MVIKSIGIQPCNEDGETKFGLIDIDPQKLYQLRQKIYYRQNSRIQTSSHSYFIKKWSASFIYLSEKICRCSSLKIFSK